MKKRDIVAAIFLLLGTALITTALVIVFLHYPNRANPIDKTIADFFFSYNNEALTKIMRIITFLGESIIYVAVLVILYYIWDKSKAYKTILILISSVFVVATAKVSFHLDRPDEFWGYKQTSETSYGLPSGHTQLSTTFWGALATIIPKWGMLSVGVVLPILIGFSRIFLVVHWFTDVLMGFGIGLIIIGLFIFLEESISNYIEKQSIKIKFLFVLLLFVVFAIPIIFLHKNNIPNEFEQEINILKVLVLFTTGSLSYAIEGKIVDYDSKVDRWWKIILRILIVTIPIAIMYVYDQIITKDMPLDALKISLDMVVYAIMGPILFLLFPWIIKKLNW